MVATRPDDFSGTCKIDRDVDVYGLTDLNDDLLRYRQEHGASLRDLAIYVNHRVLESAIEAASGNVLGSEGRLFGAVERVDAVAAIYGALEKEDESPDRRARVQTRLEQAGVNLSSVKKDWVTHPTVRRHLQECMGIDTSSERTINQDDAQNTIEWAQSRCTAVIGRTFERLQLADKLRVSNLDVTIAIRTTCTECGKTYSPDQLISRGHCDCYVASDTARPIET